MSDFCPPTSALLIQEDLTRDDFQEQVIETALVGDGLLYDLVDFGSVGGFHLASGGVGEQFGGEVAGEEAEVLDHDVLESADIGELFAIGHAAGGINFVAGFVFGPPGSDSIEILQGKSEWIDLLVAVVTGLDGAVFGVHFPNGEVATGVGLGNIHIRRRRLGMNAKKVFQDVDATDYWRGVDSIGRSGEHGSLAKETTSFALPCQRDLLELGCGIDFDIHSVVPDQVGVEKGEIGIEEGVQG